MANPFSTLETLVRNLVQSVNALVQAVTNATPGVPSPTLGAAGDYLNVNGSTTGYQFRTPSEVRGDIGAAASGANSDITSLSGLTTPLTIAQGGTGETTAAAALTALGAAASGANSDITSLSGLTTALSIAQGGTGAATAAAALSALGAASETAVKNVRPIGASASANPGTSLSLTTPSLTAPSNGYAIIDFMSNCSNSTYLTGATVSATLGAVTEIASQGVYDQKYGKYYIAMNAGQSSTFSLDVTTNASVQIGAILNVTFIPTP